MLVNLITTIWRVGWSGPTQIPLLYNQKASCSCCWAVSEQSCSHIAFEQPRQQQQQPTTTDALSSLFSSSSRRIRMESSNMLTCLSLSFEFTISSSSRENSLLSVHRLSRGKRRDENVYATDGHNLIHTCISCLKEIVYRPLLSPARTSLSPFSHSYIPVSYQLSSRRQYSLSQRK